MIDTVDIESQQLNLDSGDITFKLVNGSINNLGSVLKAGHSPGIMSISGDLIQSQLSTLEVEIGGTEESDYDRYIIGGKFTAGGVLDVVLINEFVPTQGFSIDIIDFATVSGEFDEIKVPSLDGKYNWDTSTLLEDGVLRLMFDNEKEGVYIKGKPLNYPNPFRLSEGTKLQYYLGQAMNIEILFLKRIKI